MNHHSPAPETTDAEAEAGSPSPGKRPKIEAPSPLRSASTVHPEDSDVEVLTPTRFKAAAAIEAAIEGEDVVVTSTNVTNPNVDYPHARGDCGAHPFRAGGGGGGEGAAAGGGNEDHCPKCYCYVCDAPASRCRYWTASSVADASADGADDAEMKELGPHCHARRDKGRWDGLKARLKKSDEASAALRDVAAPTYNPYARSNSGFAGLHSAEIEVLTCLSNLPDAASGSAAAGTERIRARKEMRIPEVLLENFRQACSLGDAANRGADNNGADAGGETNKTEGDIPPLAHPTFVDGIRIGFPFSRVMKPQRQIMIHLIRALKGKRHVVLESPTGTGKSAAILCSVLAWQRWHANRSPGGDNGDGEGRVKIIYCSRTHSQVAQMVSSLRSTPYRPRMAILGSRDRLCIHKAIRPRNPGAEPTGVNVNNECRTRVRNTEKYRKSRSGNPSSEDAYADESPPDVLAGDGAEVEGAEGEEGDGGSFVSRSKTCPHYRQLTAPRIANLARSAFVPLPKASCCSVGGKKSKFGSHDIEDLVEFGKDPYSLKGVALYRGKEEGYGLTLEGPKGGGCRVSAVKKGTPADMSEVRSGDVILRVNGSDVRDRDAAGVARAIKEAPGDSLTLDVSRGGSGSSDGYSSHAACPYYVSAMLAKDAELVFAPYNYVLDPSIRRAMGIELANSVVVLDEGHNIESTLRDAGSGRFGEFELCDLIVMLNNYAITERSTHNMMEVEGGGDVMYMCDVAHALLLFVEKLVTKLRSSRSYFESNSGPKGADAVLKEYERFHTSDDTEFEVVFHGPTGHGVRGVPVGCLPFFEELGILESDFELLERYVDAFDKNLRGKDSNESTGERDRINNLMDSLIDLVHKMCSARKASEHYYAAIVTCANGSLDFANGSDAEGNDEGGRRSWKKKPRALPLIAPRTPQNPNRLPNPCLHAYCKGQCANILDPVRHGQSCDGSTPKWEAVLNLQLLTPGPLFQEIADECRTVVLASGSLAPIPSLCAELNLFSSNTQITLPSTSNPSTPQAIVQKRLQTQPPPLEADHVVNLDKQLFVASIGHFPDGSDLQVSQRYYKKDEFLEKLGDAIVKIVEGIPEGGVLVFLPSYALLRRCERMWNPAGNRSNSNRRSYWSQFDESDGPSVWDRLKVLKHNVIVEPSGGGQTEFEEKKKEYMDSVDNRSCCVLFAVYRGKMSEGISFNDNYARGVICIGVPLPNAFSLPIKVKQSYNEEQRKLRHRTDLLPGREWYNQQAYRAIAQALGRCIRHSDDFGAIFLMDARHCDNGGPNDGTPNAHKNLPKWMRKSVQNLDMNSTPRNPMFNYGSSSKTICGGYEGLKKELQKFFREAKPFVAQVQSQNASRLVATNSAIQNGQQFTPPPLGSSRAPLSISSSSNSSVVKSVQQIQLSTTSKSSMVSTESDEVVILDGPPSRNSAMGVKVAPRQNTLMDAFKKQKENEPAAKPPKVAKRSTTPTNLKAMFERQLSAASSSQELKIAEDAQKQDASTTGQTVDSTMEVDNQLSTSSCTMPLSSTQEMSATTTQLQAAINPTTHSFERSPFAQYAYSPPRDATLAPQQQIGLASSSASNHQAAIQGSNEADEHLCVICEDGKKQVVILPCKHMCLCKACADFDRIKECPLCRTKVESSITVFI